MREFHKMRLNWQRGFYLLVTGCIALLLLLSTAQLVHTHADGHIDHDCALCFSAHQSVQVSPQVALQVTQHQVANIIVLRRSNRPRHNVILLPVNRPPPVLSEIA